MNEFDSSLAVGIHLDKTCRFQIMSKKTPCIICKRSDGRFD